MTTNGGRRLFLASAGGLALVGACRAPGREEREECEEGVGAVEDLMREHGLLERLLLVYEECIRKLRAGEPPASDLMLAATSIMRRFVEGYHEKTEERHVFPRFRQAGAHVELVDLLEEQHKVGARLTVAIEADCEPARLRDDAGRRRLADGLAASIRMYRPHRAWEDTVLFPALHAIVAPRELEKLGEAFEDDEHAVLGADGFERAVAEVAALQTRLGIADLRAFTPLA